MRGKRCYQLTEKQFARLEPYLPADTRGKPRVDDRRVISGIVHVLMTSCRWKDAPPVRGLRKTLYNRFQRWEAKGGLVAPVPRFGNRGLHARRIVDRLLRGQGRDAVLLVVKGERNQAIGRSRGYALTDKPPHLIPTDWRPGAGLRGRRHAARSIARDRFRPSPPSDGSRSRTSTGREIMARRAVEGGQTPRPLQQPRHPPGYGAEVGRALPGRRCGRSSGPRVATASFAPPDAIPDGQPHRGAAEPDKRSALPAAAAPIRSRSTITGAWSLSDAMPSS